MPAIGSHRRFARPGLTLIELVVVVAILAILAGLVIPQIDFLRRSADKAGASTAIAQVVGNLQLYRTTFGNYPDQFDSLLASPGAGGLYGKLSDELNAATTGKLSSATLTAQQLASLNEVGIKTVMDHDAASTVPADSGVSARSLAVGGKVAVVNTSSAAGLEIADSIYPPTTASGDAIPANVTLVVVGVGPRNKAVGTTLQSPPVYSSVNADTTYNRILAVFAVYSDGRAAALKAALDSNGDYLNEELREYYQSKPQ
jgi:prepilin-type N-terminal cleavage/methylation domain-containing protein